ncbi:hypothetical protein CR513_51773, partial [Mucuna pruriens]
MNWEMKIYHHGIRTRSTFKDQAQMTFLSKVEPKNIEEALLDNRWIFVMQEELDQFENNDVWKLVSPPNDKFIIGTNMTNYFANGIVQRPSNFYEIYANRLRSFYDGRRKKPR